jgi:hypothetical protein
MWNVRLNMYNYTVCGEDPQYVSPGASLYMEYPTESPLNQDGAAKHMERNKRSRNAKIAPPSTPPPAAVTPFVIEASGRLGPAAISFLRRICPTQTFLRTHFLHEISLICARALGRCFGLPAIVTVEPFHKGPRQLVNG